MIDEKEVVAGIVLHLDPDELERKGGSATCAKSFRVQGGHFFLCIGSEGGKERLIPLYTRPGKGRTLLAANGRSGHSKWTNGTFYWHSGQVWTAPVSAVVSAASVGKDASSKGNRNTMDGAQIPKV